MTTEREMDAAEAAYHEWQALHSDCTLARCVKGDVDCPAGLILDCWECNGYDPRSAPVKRRVVKLGPVVNRADPTQTYILACGHTTI